MKIPQASTDYVQFNGVFGSSDFSEIDVSLWFRTTSTQELVFFEYVITGQASNELHLAYSLTNTRFTMTVGGQNDRYVYANN